MTKLLKTLKEFSNQQEPTPEAHSVPVAPPPPEQPQQINCKNID